jgi:tRNA_anti-like
MNFRTAQRRCVNLAVAFLVFIPALAARRAAAADSQPAKVSAKDLTAAFLKDEKAAALKYGDAMTPKEVIVEGTVAELVNGKYGKIARLEGESKTVVSCLLRKEDEGSVNKGDTITIKGKCRGLFKKEKLVDLNGGILVKDQDK